MEAIGYVLFFCGTLGIAIGLYAAQYSPIGYQDEKGFHFGPDPRQNH